MAISTFGQPTADFPRATRAVAGVISALFGLGRRANRSSGLEGFSPARREDIGLSLADMRRISG